MTTERLRDELARIAESAPVLDVPRDTYSRGRRTRDRDRLLVAGAAVAAVALVAGIASWLPTSSAPPIASGDGRAVPSRVWNVPAHVAQQDLDLAYSGDVETDLAVGSAAVAYVTDNGVPVLVGAGDGGYHLLALPGFPGRSVEPDLGNRLVLSPDGSHLAYPYVDTGGRTPGAAMPTGIRDLDLVTGQVRTIPLTGGEGVLVAGIAWAPNGDWLVWHGQPTTRWDDASSFGTDAKVTAGRIAAGASTSEPVPAARDSATQYAVSDWGEVGIVTTNSVTRWDGGPVNEVQVGAGDPFTGSVVDADGTFPVHAGYAGDVLLTLRSRDVDYSYQLLAYTTTASRAYAEAEIEIHLPEDLSRLAIAPIRWLDPERMLARSGTPDDDSSAPLTDLVVVEVGDDPSYDVIGSFEEGTPLPSIATNLLGADPRTVDRPEPDWPWTQARLSLAIGLGIAAILSVLAAARWLWRRRTR